MIECRQFRPFDAFAFVNGNVIVALQFCCCGIVMGVSTVTVDDSARHVVFWPERLASFSRSSGFVPRRTCSAVEGTARSRTASRQPHCLTYNDFSTTRAYFRAHRMGRSRENCLLISPKTPLRGTRSIIETCAATSAHAPKSTALLDCSTINPTVDFERMTTKRQCQNGTCSWSGMKRSLSARLRLPPGKRCHRGSLSKK